MIGRENTMFIAFGMEGIGIWGLYCWATIPSGSCCCRASCSSPGARSTPSSRRPAPTPSARSSRPPMPACSTRQRHRGAAGACGELHAAVFGHLGHRVHRRGGREYPGLGAGDRGAQAGAKGWSPNRRCGLIRTGSVVRRARSSSGMGAFSLPRRPLVYLSAF